MSQNSSQDLPTLNKICRIILNSLERNPCGANNYGCSHLCLLANHFGRRTVVCKCPRNMTLDKSKKKCKGIPATRGPKSTATKKVPTTVTIQSTYKKVTKSKSTQTRMVKF